MVKTSVYHQGMNITLSHMTAFEYWRLVGIPGILTPHITSVCNVSPPASLVEGEWPAMLRALVAKGHLIHPVHICASRRPTCKVTPEVSFHLLNGQLPRKQIYSISEDLGIVSPELCLLQVANIFSLVELIGLMHEFCGFYSPSGLTENGLVSRDPLTSVERIAAAASKFKGLHGVRELSRAVRYVKGPSRSPMETALAMCLSLPYMLGGYSISDLELNSKVQLDVPLNDSRVLKVLEPDILFRDSKLCVEYDGRAFHEGTDAVRRDVGRANALSLSGYDVVTLTASQVMSCSQFHKEAMSIARKVGKRVRIRDINGFAARRADLRRQVLGSQSVLRGLFGATHVK